MLQLLVSIQALILNQKPYFNEPGYEQSKGTESGELVSEAYSENIFILSLKTMVYSMRKPPKVICSQTFSCFFLRFPKFGVKTRDFLKLLVVDELCASTLKSLFVAITLSGLTI